jgi:opacity protein-like surface antigen
MRSHVKNACVLTLGAALVTAIAFPAVAEDHHDISAAFALHDLTKAETTANDVLLAQHGSTEEIASPMAGAETKPATGDDTTAEPQNGTQQAELGSACGDGCCSCCCRNPWYISISGAWQQRETVHEVDDSRVFIEFDSGFAANAALGVRLESFRLEFETSFMNNEVDRAGAGGLSSSSPGNVNLRAYMFNVYHDIEFKSTCWKPYVGAGIGVYQSDINGLIPDFFSQVSQTFARTPINATSDMPFAYQFRVGVTRPICCNTEFYTGYRYFRGEELEFASAPFAGPNAPTFHPDGAKVHAIEFGLRVNF